MHVEQQVEPKTELTRAAVSEINSEGKKKMLSSG
jgi:hypothetical protein